MDDNLARIMLLSAGFIVMVGVIAIISTHWEEILGIIEVINQKRIIKM
ncbi:MULTISPECIES: hypothetical protein [Vagococcus]|uniref:Uncharacterized protein n=1 Tax=Vagococcus fluvialis bH819 TaxID=1255619 RepID=A0A1X6WTY8_9ENTE|nr:MULTISPECIES: hypothetical protein [Vagococcus]SLM87086.1 hypothetical protein FM121_13390 [Vagococcus fluvialis bH819]